MGGLVIPVEYEVGGIHIYIEKIYSILRICFNLFWLDRVISVSTNGTLVTNDSQRSVR